MAFRSNQNMIDDPLSYRSIQNSIKNFRSLKGDNFNLYDEPGTYWFKPIFYFVRSGGSTEGINNEGLLYPVWNMRNYNSGDGANQDMNSEATRRMILDTDFTTCAYNYLVRNDDNRRAVLLQRFVELLSNIATRSPWYFQSVSGLDTAIDHSEAFKTGKFFGDDRRQITFKLLPDAVDNRIGTLLDLYRSICYSWSSKREIVPSNLRKFDMGIYIFGSMIQNEWSDLLHTRAALTGTLRTAEKLGLDLSSKQSIVNAAGEYSYDGRIPKGQANIYLEFTNCEINLSSLKGGDEVSNTTGSTREYTLTIDYDDCYVNRYNDFIIGAIGDVIISDIISEDATFSMNSEGNYTTEASIGRRVYSDNMISKAINNSVNNVVSATLGTAMQLVQNTAGNILLGNLYNGSIVNSTYQLTNGRFDVIENSINAAIDKEEQKKTELQFKNSVSNYSSQNLYQMNRNNTNENYKSEEKDISGSLYPNTYPQERIKQLGNLYKSTAAINNL